LPLIAGKGLSFTGVSLGFMLFLKCVVVFLIRHLRELDLQENEIDDHRGQWLNCFPDSCTTLMSLNFACLKGETNVAALERLVARSPNLKSLKLNRAVPLDALARLMSCAPQLVDLGVGSYENEPDPESFATLMTAIKKYTSLRSLSGFLEVAPLCLPAFYPICQNLISLNLSYAAEIQGNHLIKLIQLCKRLQRLWVSLFSLSLFTVLKKIN